MFPFHRRTKPARKTNRKRAVARKPCLEILEDRTLLDTYLGNFGVSYFSQAAGNSPPSDGNPYNNVQVSPGPYHINASPGKYYLVTTGFNPGHYAPGASVWSGDASSGTRIGLSAAVGARTDFTLTHGEIVLYAWDWYPWDNDPQAISYYDLYKVSATDIAATKLEWNTAQGSVDFSYKVSGEALPKDTTAMLYWASGTTPDTILEPATTPIPIPHTTPLDQIQTVHLAPADFPGGPAPGAKYLLAVVDPDNRIDEGATGEANNVKELTIPDITMLSAQLTSPTAVTCEYATTGTINQPFTVALYRSANPTFEPGTDPLVQYTTVTPSFTNPQAPVVLSTDPNAIDFDPAMPYLLVVADPPTVAHPQYGEIEETDETNNVAVVPLSDLEATSLSWNIGQGGVDFSYAVKGTALTQNVVAALYWARGATFADVIDPAHPAYSTPIEHPVGSYGPFYVPSSVLGTPPAGATRLLLMVDPSNSANELNTTRGDNTASIPFYVLKDATVRAPLRIAGRLDLIAAEYYRITRTVLFLTDGERTAAEMAAILLPRLSTEQGRKCERKIYRRNADLLEEIIAAYDSNNTDAARLAAMTATIQAQINRGRYISPHLRNNAVDIRSRGFGAVDIGALRRAIRIDPGAEIVDETTRKTDPHWHLQFS
jgi:hypothetical protein